MEAAGSSEMLVPMKENTWFHIHKEDNFNINGCLSPQILHFYDFSSIFCHSSSNHLQQHTHVIIPSMEKVLKKSRVVQRARYSPLFMEHEGSFPCSHEATLHLPEI
jgi:hypothetical protein